MRNIFRFAVVVLVLATLPRPAGAQDAQAELRDRFAGRYARLLELQDQGKIGETWRGEVKAVEPEYAEQAEVKALIDAENADRRRLYELLADELRREVRDETERERVTVELIARRNAQRNFDRARPEHYLLISEHTWIKKKDERRHRALLDMKKRGVAGETWEGYVEATGSRDLDAGERAALDQENRERRKTYERLAAMRKTSVEVEARRKAEGYFKDARREDFLKQRSGGWVQRGR